MCFSNSKFLKAFWVLLHRNSIISILRISNWTFSPFVVTFMSLQAGMFHVFWGFHSPQFQICQQLYKDILYVSNYTRICLKWISAAMQAPDAFCITWPSQMTPLCINRIISLISCKLTNENARNKFSKLRIIRLFCMVIVTCTSIFPLEFHSFGLKKNHRGKAAPFYTSSYFWQVNSFRGVLLSLFRYLLQQTVWICVNCPHSSKDQTEKFSQWRI